MVSEALRVLGASGVKNMARSHRELGYRRTRSILGCWCGGVFGEVFNQDVREPIVEGNRFCQKVCNVKRMAQARQIAFAGDFGRSVVQEGMVKDDGYGSQGDFG